MDQKGTNGTRKMDFSNLVIAVTCAGGLAEVIRHGSIFEEWRSRHETANTRLKPLLMCGFCFSHWSAAITVVLMTPWIVWPGRWWAYPGYLTAIWFSVTRLSNLVNDLSYRYNRTSGPRGSTDQNDEMKNKE